MISILESDGHANTNQIDRLLEKYARQIEHLLKAKFFENAKMGRKVFIGQAEMLKDKLRKITDLPDGEIPILVCLPPGSLIKRVRRIRCGRNAGWCDCNLNALRTNRPSRTLYALIGVCDGRQHRLSGNGEADAHRDIIREIVAPRQSMNAWEGMELLTQNPETLRQHGLVFGETTIKNAATAIWIRLGQPLFGSTEGKKFREAWNDSRTHWGIPSYTQKVVL